MGDLFFSDGQSSSPAVVSPHFATSLAEYMTVPATTAPIDPYEFSISVEEFVQSQLEQMASPIDVSLTLTTESGVCFDSAPSSSTTSPTKMSWVNTAIDTPSRGGSSTMSPFERDSALFPIYAPFEGLNLSPPKRVADQPLYRKSNGFIPPANFKSSAHLAFNEQRVTKRALRHERRCSKLELEAAEILASLSQHCRPFADVPAGQSSAKRAKSKSRRMRLDSDFAIAMKQPSIYNELPSSASSLPSPPPSPLLGSAASMELVSIDSDVNEPRDRSRHMEATTPGNPPPLPRALHHVHGAARARAIESSPPRPGVRVCIACRTRRSPCWRPSWDPKLGQLCNSCGIRYRKCRARCASADCAYIPSRTELAEDRAQGTESICRACNGNVIFLDAK